MRDAELLLPLTEEWDRELASADPLEFPGYAEALAAAPGESIRTGLVASAGVRAVLIQSDFEIFGGTMGAVAGEKIVRSFRRAVDQRLPVVAVTRTGGARMQEGMASLIQMPRTVTAVDEHARSGLLSAIVYRSPTTGGVFASWAALLDVRAAEPHATMGFAGPRVVRQVTGQAPPAGSHTEKGVENPLLHRNTGPDALSIFFYPKPHSWNGTPRTRRVPDSTRATPSLHACGLPCVGSAVRTGAAA